MWVPPEDTDPVVLQTPIRKNIAFFGAVRLSEAVLVTQRAESFNSEAFQTFLSRIIRRKRKGRKIIVVADNARWHHAKATAPWLHTQRKKLRLDFLPPYSPELNHIEIVWKLTRGLCTHNQYFHAIEKLIGTAEEQFATWSAPNNALH